MSFSFSCFGFIVRTDRRNHSDAAKRFTPETVVGERNNKFELSNSLIQVIVHILRCSEIRTETINEFMY